MSFVAALLYALLMAALPLVEVIHSGRPPATLLLLYWFETVLLLVTGTIRIVAHRRATAKTGHYAPTTVVSKSDAGVATCCASSATGHVPAPLRRPDDRLHDRARHLRLLLVFLFEVGGPVTWGDCRRRARVGRRRAGRVARVGPGPDRALELRAARRILRRRVDPRARHAARLISASRRSGSPDRPGA
jgi:hypothetical protein